MNLTEMKLTEMNLASAIGDFCFEEIGKPGDVLEVHVPDDGGEVSIHGVVTVDQFIDRWEGEANVNGESVEKPANPNRRFLGIVHKDGALLIPLGY